MLPSGCVGGPVVLWQLDFRFFPSPNPSFHLACFIHTTYACTHTYLLLQASVYVTTMLFAACQEISRIGGHTMDRYVQSHCIFKWIGCAYVPGKSQLSPPLSHLFWCLLRNVLQQFTGKCLRGVLEVHLTLLDNLTSTLAVAMHQNCALQLLFNIRFLCGVLSSPKEMEVRDRHT